MENLVKIKYGSYEAVINLSRGANCINFKNSKYKANILREPNYSKGLDNPYLYGMPLLFPQNRISNGKFIFEGREYSFPINEEKTGCHLHGTLHETPFNLVSFGESYVTARFDSDGDYHGFPHAFTITVSYRLSSRGLSVSHEIKNNSKTNMPILLGHHTTFNIPFVAGSDKDSVYLCADISEEVERDMETYLPTGKILPPDAVFEGIKRGSFPALSKIISKHYKAGENGIITLYDKNSGVTLTYLSDKKYKFRLFYNGDANEYISLEPITNLADAPNTSFDYKYSGLAYIKPGRIKKYKMKIHLNKTCEVLK